MSDSDDPPEGGVGEPLTGPHTPAVEAQVQPGAVADEVQDAAALPIQNAEQGQGALPPPAGGQPGQLGEGSKRVVRSSERRGTAPPWPPSPIYSPEPALWNLTFVRNPRFAGLQLRRAVPGSWSSFAKRW